MKMLKKIIYNPKRWWLLAISLYAFFLLNVIGLDSNLVWFIKLFLLIIFTFVWNIEKEKSIFYSLFRVLLVILSALFIPIIFSWLIVTIYIIYDLDDINIAIKIFGVSYMTLGPGEGSNTNPNPQSLPTGGTAGSVASQGIGSSGNSQGSGGTTQQAGTISNTEPRRGFWADVLGTSRPTPQAQIPSDVGARGANSVGVSGPSNQQELPQSVQTNTPTINQHLECRHPYRGVLRANSNYVADADKYTLSLLNGCFTNIVGPFCSIEERIRCAEDLKRAIKPNTGVTDLTFNQVATFCVIPEFNCQMPAEGFTRNTRPKLSLRLENMTKKREVCRIIDRYIDSNRNN